MIQTYLAKQVKKYAEKNGVYPTRIVLPYPMIQECMERHGVFLPVPVPRYGRRYNIVHLQMIQGADVQILK